MMYKVLLALAVVLTISALGGALKCDVCAYSSVLPAAKRVCTTVDCPTGNCYKLNYTGAGGTDVVEAGCDVLNYCADINKVCADRIEKFKAKSCQSSCCKKDKCNSVKNDDDKKDDVDKGTYPNSATGIMATKFALFVMIVAGYLSA